MTAPLRVSRSGAWLFGRQVPRTIGRGGITCRKREGDGATPAGLLRVTAALYRPERLGREALPPWAQPMPRGLLWSDDPADPAYNRPVLSPDRSADGRRFGHEVMRRPDGLYDLVLLTDWNAFPPVPKRGSAIFLHVWRGPAQPTEGCIAFPLPVLLRVAWALPPGAGVLVRGAA